MDFKIKSPPGFISHKTTFISSKNDFYFGCYCGFHYYWPRKPTKIFRHLGPTLYNLNFKKFKNTS